MRQLNSPNIEVVKKDCLAVDCGDFGKRGGEEDEKKNEAAAAEGGLRKMPWEIEAERRGRPENVDISSEGEKQVIQSVTGETKMKVKRFVAKHRLDVRATPNLENSSDSVAEKVIETPMGHKNNPSAYISKAVDVEMREEEIAWHSSTIGQTREGEPVPEWEDEEGGGEWCGEQAADAAWYEGNDGGVEEDWEEGDDEEVAGHGGWKSPGEDDW